MPTAPHALRISGVPSAMAVISIEGEETLGGLYRYEIRCEAPIDASEVARQALTQRGSLLLGGGDEIGGRTVWGQITSSRLSYTRGVPILHLTIEPRLTALRGLRLNQAFLEQSSITTVQAVLTQAGLSAQWQDWQTISSYPLFAQRTCLEQDALGFVLWLLEHEGIGLRFEQTPSGERMVFFDDLGGYDRSLPYMRGVRVAHPAGLTTDSDAETLTHASVSGSVAADAVRLTDYDYRQSQLDLSADASDPYGDGLTVQHHGEHYKTTEDGVRLAKVRLQELQCRQRQLKAQGPLLSLIAGSVIRIDADALDATLFDSKLAGDTAGYWLVTHLHLSTHRDGSLVVCFEASDAEQMWRPARVTVRPKVHGLLSAKISGGSFIAELDEAGRYRIGYPWQDSASSKAIRLAQSYAGPEYGHHAPLKDETEVWLTHANGDPDRPLILGATHHGLQPDVITAKDNSRNVLKTVAGNKLRMEDREGQEHIKLATPAALTQLILGQAVDHDKKNRGLGLELRTDAHGAVRSGNQLQITTGEASPRSAGEARNTQSSAEIRATLDNLKAFVGNRSTAAHQVGVRRHQSVPSATWVQTALSGTATTPVGVSKPNQFHWALGGHVNVAPTISLMGTNNVAFWSIGPQDWLAGGKIQIAARDATRVHIEQGGRKSFVSEGNWETTVTKGSYHLIVDGSLLLQSETGDVSFKAGGASLLLTHDGHAGLKSNGTAIYQAEINIAKAPAVKVQGCSTARVPGALPDQGGVRNSVCEAIW